MIKELKLEQTKLNKKRVLLSMEFGNNFAQTTEDFFIKHLDMSMVSNIISSFSLSSKRLNFKIVGKKYNEQNYAFIHGFISLKSKDKSLEFTFNPVMAEKSSLEEYSNQVDFINMIYKSFNNLNFKTITDIFNQCKKQRKDLEEVKNHLFDIDNKITIAKNLKEIKKINMLFGNIDKKEAEANFANLTEENETYIYYHFTEKGLVFEKQKLSVSRNNNKTIYYSGYNIISKKRCKDIINSELLFKGKRISKLSDIDFFDNNYDHRDFVTFPYESIMELIKPLIAQLTIAEF